MSWHFSQALVEEFWGASSLDGEPCAPWKSTPIALDDSCSGKMKAIFHHSQFGMMFVPSTDALGEELLTLFLAAFPARTSPSQEKGKASTESAADFGFTRPESFAKWSQTMRGWKIRQHSLFEDLEQSLAIWPKWGSMQNGECCHVPMLVEFTYESESGLKLPTIGANEYKGSSAKRFIGSPDFRGAKMSEGLRTCETDPIYLHPSFAELVMMWPMGWTESTPLATDKFQEWLNSHGGF